MTQNKPFDQVSFLSSLEEGTLEQAQVVEGMQKLINSGTINHLQGTHQRLAQSLIDSGECTPAPHRYSPVVGPFHDVRLDEIKQVGGLNFRVVLYGAYSADGLLSNSSNGVGILSEEQAQVVCDQIAQGLRFPTEDQVAEFRKIMEMTDKEFVEMINTNPRSRLTFKSAAKSGPRP